MSDAASASQSHDFGSRVDRATLMPYAYLGHAVALAASLQEGQSGSDRRVTTRRTRGRAARRCEPEALAFRVREKRSSAGFDTCSASRAIAVGRWAVAIGSAVSAWRAPLLAQRKSREEAPTPEPAIHAAAAGTQLLPLWPGAGDVFGTGRAQHGSLRPSRTHWGVGKQWGGPACREWGPAPCWRVLAGYVGEDCGAAVELADVGEFELERGGVDVFEQALAGADHDGHDP